MNEETKVKVRQINEMISIYQTTISDDLDQENMKLIHLDLQNKQKQLNEVKDELDRQLSKLYENGANEIDVEVNQLQREIQEIHNSIENISDIISMIILPSQQLQTEEISEELNLENNLEDDSQKNFFEIEAEEEFISEAEMSNVEGIENVQYIEPTIEEVPLQEDMEEFVITNDEVLVKESEIPKEVSFVSSNENEIEVLEETIALEEVEKTTKSGEFEEQKRTIKLDVANKTYQEEIAKMLENRKKNNIGVVIQAGIQASNEIIEKIKNILGVENLGSEKIAPEEKVQEENIRER